MGSAAIRSSNQRSGAASYRRGCDVRWWVLNAVVLFNIRYMDAAVERLRADGFEIRDEDAARLSPFVRVHINMLDC
jgi:hypothetical protein